MKQGPLVETEGSQQRAAGCWFECLSGRFWACSPDRPPEDGDDDDGRDIRVHGEMPHTGGATKESDVYSFGLLRLEVMCGVRPLATTSIERGDGILVARVWRAHEAGNILQVADSRLGTFPLSDSVSYGGLESQEATLNLITRDVVDVNPSVIYAPDAAIEERKMITNLLHLGLLCCNPNPEDRPSTRLVS